MSHGRRVADAVPVAGDEAGDAATGAAAVAAVAVAVAAVDAEGPTAVIDVVAVASAVVAAASAVVDDVSLGSEKTCVVVLSENPEGNTWAQTRW